MDKIGLLIFLDLATLCLIELSPGVEDVSASKELKAHVSDESCLAGIGGFPRYRTSTTMKENNFSF